MLDNINIIKKKIMFENILTLIDLKEVSVPCFTYKAIIENIKDTAMTPKNKLIRKLDNPAIIIRAKLPPLKILAIFLLSKSP